jgi:hypothetical protein
MALRIPRLSNASSMRSLHIEQVPSTVKVTVSYFGGLPKDIAKAAKVMMVRFFIVFHSFVLRGTIHFQSHKGM